MTAYDPKKHQRRSIRLKGYDYRLEGAYFITLVTQGRENLFGEVVKGEMHLNLRGQCAAACWQALSDRNNIRLGAWVVMPNHLHGIIFINTRRGEASGDDSGRGEASGRGSDLGRSIYLSDASPLLQPRPARVQSGTVPGSLNAIIQNYKSITTRRIHAQPGCAGLSVWQRNYYEHIIRDEEALQRIHLYIETNISHWGEDEYHVEN